MFRNVNRISLFNSPDKLRYSTRIFHITDSEGSPSFYTAIHRSKTVKYHPDSGLSFHNTNEIPYFIFGGDLTDRGNYDLNLTQTLLDFKKRHPDNVYLLAGNREITKTRFKIELAPGLIRERLLHSESPRWLPNHPTVPVDYVKAAMMASHRYAHINETDIKEFVHSLSTTQCQVIYLKWMLEKTMGCPHTFRYRREEIQRELKKDCVSDEEVLDSILQESSPEGITGQYLQLTQIGVIIPGTGVLAVHGGLQTSNIGRIPNMASSDQRVENANRWIDQFNQWYKQQIAFWIAFQPNQLTPPACTDLDDCALPLPNKPKSIITADMLNSDREFSLVSDEVIDYLQANGIQLVLTGHQPCGDHPTILRTPSSLFINGDTGYAAFDPKNIDNTRGNTCHSLDISAGLDKTSISIHATLPDKTTVNTELSVTKNGIDGDPHIGKITTDNQLIQCQLPNGNYRLIQQKGIQVQYTIVNQDDIQRMLPTHSKFMPQITTARE